MFLKFQNFMNNKIMGQFKKWVTGKEGREGWQKKKKHDLGEGFAGKKVMSLSQKTTFCK